MGPSLRVLTFCSEVCAVALRCEQIRSLERWQFQGDCRCYRFNAAQIHLARKANLKGEATSSLRAGPLRRIKKSEAEGCQQDFKACKAGRLVYCWLHVIAGNDPHRATDTEAVRTD